MRKTKTAYINDIVHDYVNRGRKKNVLHLMTQDASYNGREILVLNQRLINYGSCSYLGLDLDKRLIASAKSYMDRYGVQFSSSRTYLVPAPYTEWEELLEQIFGHPVVTFTSVTVGHHAVIPVIVEPGDAIILDQQVHASVQDPAKKMMLNGIHVEPIRHNRLDILEERVKLLNNRYERIWYMIDGVYSMYGDFAPMKEIVALMDKYPKLHVYADDAHGMSIDGRNGTGVICGQVPLHRKMVLATSLNKAFAAGGSVFVFPDQELGLKVKNCGGPYIFSGPHQIPVIGAGIASAKIHLSDEIYYRQDELSQKLKYCHQLLLENDLPILSNPQAPIFYIGVGLVNTCLQMVSYLHKDGCYVNVGMFPAVPDQSAGIRFTITLHHTKEDIEYLVERIAYHYPRTFQELGRSVQDIHRGFQKVKKFDSLIKGIPLDIIKKGEYEIQYEPTIDNIPEALWNELVGKLGANDWKQLKFFEETFIGNEMAEHNWRFHYFIIRNKEGEPIIATFFTEALAKDDMFAPAEVSKQLEAQRNQKEGKYYLSSKTLTMGCLLSVGQHVYIDRENINWKEAFTLLLDAIQEHREQENIAVLSLRDFDAHDEEMREFFIDQGMKRINIHDGHVINGFNWNTNDEFIEQLKGSSSKSTQDRRSYIKKRVFQFEDRYEVRIVKNASPEEIEHYRQLYLNVSNKSYEITGYNLHDKFFKNIAKHPQWEILELRLKPEYDTRKERKAIGIALSYKTDHLYSFLVTGMDYDFLEDHNVYPQILWQTIKRARELGVAINLGITASQSKRKFGARLLKNSIYVQNKDTFKDTLMGLIANREMITA